MGHSVPLATTKLEVVAVVLPRSRGGSWKGVKIRSGVEHVIQDLEVITFSDSFGWLPLPLQGILHLVTLAHFLVLARNQAL